MNYAQNLLETLESIDISGIENIQFFIKNGGSFIVKTDNIKRLAVYISENKDKRVFLPGELNDIFAFVSKYITTDISEDILKIISEKIKLFCISGGEIKFNYQNYKSSNTWNYYIPFESWVEQIIPVNIELIKSKISMLRFIAIAFLFPWSFFAFGGLFMFDAPGSGESRITNQLFQSIMIYPILIVISIIVSMFFIKLSHIRTALFISFIPFINIIWFFILFFILSTKCNGNFVCSY